MKKIFIIAFIILNNQWSSFAQTFISKARIEFEVKANMHKQMGEDGIWAEMAKENMSKFSISYYDYIFSNNKSIYKFNRYDDKNKSPWQREDDDHDLWYNDYNSSLSSKLKYINGEAFILRDSLMNIEWKMTNESREIAGFFCRKAYAKIFDSVYVFAFYTDEITISGGPMGLHGLPGMILGVTIPRLYTSYIATKVYLEADEKQIVAPTKGKIKTTEEMKKTLQEVTKSWKAEWVSNFIWSTLL